MPVALFLRLITISSASFGLIQYKEMHIKFLFLMVLLSALILPVSCSKHDTEKGGQSFNLPGPGFVADPSRGKQLFQASCAGCHGEDGRGSSHWPPLVHTFYRPGHHSDMAFYLAVKNGVREHHWNFGDMPPILGLSPEDVGHILVFVRQEQQKAGIK